MTMKRTRAALAALALFAGALPALAGGAADPLEGYNLRDVSGWEPAEAATPLAAVAPVWQDLFMEMEPMPSLDVNLAPAPDRQGYVADVTMKGYADDSVAGEQFRAIIRPTANGWTLEALGQQNICARGENAGKPQKNLCP
ncbi:MAG: hypothetical protein KDJ73_15185 [Notoacmeibacter sp.]|nr:hypothetical protein [Notoacmeibacter sp.]MCC0031904.1 hypothetical protein [Brucellaceae bacterium]